MSLINLYLDYHIDTAQSGDSHYRDNWLNTECPFCTGHFGHHLGFNLEGNYYHCFRCGGHPMFQTLMKLLNQDGRTVARIMKEYDVQQKDFQTIDRTTKDAKINLKPFKYPTHVTDLKRTHKRYLEGRGFDPDLIQKEFELQATTAFSKLDGINYAYRILAPIYWNEKVVSFQTRDYTDRQAMRYLACPMAREQEHHKHILYIRPGGRERIGFGVEGITDVWRFIKYGFATFGIEYTPTQLKVIARKYDKIFTLFDPEPQAQMKAIQLKKDLEFRNLKVENIKLDSDPGSMDQKDANRLIKELTRKIIPVK